ncbi:MAG TPA: peptidoglycan-binding domain-containing protein [Thermoleophilaceae bacterium]|jgi:peptidoglycan hydrolase-like protein with peptidoglycan-binding domain|nr:peptidoglycan-binding domain-containing protein [Thermoleophilaceae bacterium]
MKNRPSGRLLCACAATALLVLAAAPAAFGRFGSTTLRKGAHGHDVRVLQSWLDKLGYRTSVDGAFGRGTQRSVRRFEKKEKLKVDGIVDRAEAKLLRQRMDARQNGKAGSGGGSVNGGSDTTVSNPNATTPGAKARMSSDGHTALAPAGAPAQVQAVIAAANEITSTGYRYGGGHGSFDDSAYDCSGAVSHALHGADLVKSPLDSTDFESWGARGRGQWITVYANSGHAYMVVAGLRFDTSGSGEKGPRWRKQLRSSHGYVARHPDGL